MTITNLKLFENTPFAQSLKLQDQRLNGFIKQPPNSLYQPKAVALAQSLRSATSTIFQSLESLRSRNPSNANHENIRSKFADLGVKLFDFFQYLIQKKISLPAITAPDFTEKLTQQLKLLNIKTVIEQVKKLASIKVLGSDVRQHHVLTYILYQAGVSQHEAVEATGLPQSTIYRHYDELNKGIVPLALKAAQARLFVAQEYKKGDDHKIDLAKKAIQNFGISTSTAYRIIDEHIRSGINFKPTSQQQALLNIIYNTAI